MERPFKIDDLVFTFITEDGEFKMTHAEYEKNDDLRKKIGLISAPPRGRSTAFMGLTIISFPSLLVDTEKRRGEAFREAEDIIRENPLQFFIPQNQDALDFLNDTEHNMKAILASNGYGKSVLGWVDTLLQFYPCDPKWDIFTKHGVQYRGYQGPKPDGGVGIVTYELANHVNTIFPQIIQRWTPEDALKEFRRGGKGKVNWRFSPTIDICGTPVSFLTSSQSQFPFESVARDHYWWDEQGEERKFNGANARIRRRDGRHSMTLTPHKIEGRPDTGAGSFVHKMYKGEVTAGLNVKFYESTMLNVFDWIYTKESKEAAKKEWIDEPIKNNDNYKLREGRSRIYGEFQESSGLVFDNFEESVHVIQPIKIEPHWPRLRTIDHGRIAPTAALMGAIHPNGQVILYDEYYKTNRTISSNCKGIIEKCGNERVEDDTFYDTSGRPIKRYWEKSVDNKFVWTKLDSRSFQRKLDDSAYTIGDMYRINGISCIPASGMANKKAIEIVKEYLEYDPDMIHPVTKRPGSPKLLVFSTMENFLKEMRGYVNKVSIKYDQTGARIVSEDPIDRDDHLMTALMFMLSDPLTFVEVDTSSGGGFDEEEGVGQNNLDDMVVDPITGY